MRFVGLGAREMSADEGASWAAASAPTVSEVLRRQEMFNAGKLGLHDIMLHGWILAFGDGLVSMRAMSAAFGTVAIVLVYLVSRELLLMSLTDSVRAKNRSRDADSVAALSALIFAVSTVPIEYSREARMYPVLLVAILAQIWFALRAIRMRGLVNYAGACVFTALALAAHFSAFCVMASEGLWLLYLLMFPRAASDVNGATGGAQEVSRSTDVYRIADRGSVLRLAGSIALGAAITAPMMLGAMKVSAAAVAAGAINWIRPPTVWDAITIFKIGAGYFILPTIAAIGAVLGWRWAPSAVLFALIWMWVPVALLLIISFTITPMLVERYVLSSFVPLFILVAMAIWSIRASPDRCAAIALVMLLVIAQDFRFYAHRHNDAQWREAARVAASSAGPADAIGVVPAYAENVVRYYLTPERRSLIVSDISSQSANRPAVVIVFDQGLAPAREAALSADYPVQIAHFDRLNVMRRRSQGG